MALIPIEEYDEARGTIPNELEELDSGSESGNPRESDASASKQHPALTLTGWQITNTRDAVVDSLMHRSDTELEHSKQSLDEFIADEVEQGDKKRSSQSDLEGLAFNLVKAFYKNSVFLQFQMDECHKLLTNKVDLVNPEGHQILQNIYEPLPLGGPPGQAGLLLKEDFPIVLSQKPLSTRDRNDQRKLMRLNELHKAWKLGNGSEDDKERSKDFTQLSRKDTDQEDLRVLESFVVGRIRDIDYRAHQQNNVDDIRFHPPKDIETPVESPIPLSPSLSVGSSSPVRSTTPPPDYPFDESIFAELDNSLWIIPRPLGSEPVPEESNESDACLSVHSWKS
ncbi:hypothetical protein Tco_0935740 [Tanacetum coccineum]